MNEKVEEHIAKEMLKKTIDNSYYSQRTKDNTKYLIEQSKTIQDVAMALIVGRLL